MLMVSVHHSQMVALWHLVYHHIRCPWTDALARIISASSSPWPGWEPDHARSTLLVSKISTSKSGQHLFLAALCSIVFMDLMDVHGIRKTKSTTKLGTVGACSKHVFLKMTKMTLEGMGMDQKPGTVFFTPKWLHQNGYIYIYIHQNSWLFLVLIPSQLRGT